MVVVLNIKMLTDSLMWKLLICSCFGFNDIKEVSLVVFEKKLLDKVDKRDRDTVMETMKKGPVQLTRLRHPRLLVVQHPLEESK